MTSTPRNPWNAELDDDLDRLGRHLDRDARLALDEPRMPTTERERDDLAALERGFARARDGFVDPPGHVVPGPGARRFPLTAFLVAALVVGLAGLAWKFWPRSNDSVVMVDPGNTRGRQDALQLRVTQGPALDGDAFQTVHVVWTTPAAVGDEAQYRLTIRERAALEPLLELDSLRGETLSLTREERAKLEKGREYVVELEMFVGNDTMAALAGRASFRID